MITRKCFGSEWWVLAFILLSGQALLVPSGRAAEHSLPLLVPAGNAALTGFVRIINRSDRAGEVQIRAIDDTGDERTVSLAIGANASQHFNSDDLESGNPGKGLSGRVGNGECSWRLELQTELDILPLAFLRTADGFLTSIHDVVPEIEPGQHDVAFFNPGKNTGRQSRLRLINPGDSPAQVKVSGTDDRGNPSSGVAQLTVPAGGACMSTARELESGEVDAPCHCELSGGLGAGSGKWQLSVSTDRSIQVMSVLRTSEHLTNLSTVKTAGFAPGDESAFNARFVGRRVRATDKTGYIDFVASGRFRELYKERRYEGGYSYENEGPNSGTFKLDYDDGDECSALAAFDSFITGTTFAVCKDGVTDELTLERVRSWELQDIAPEGMAPQDQGEFDRLVASHQLTTGAASGLGGPVVFGTSRSFSQGSGNARRDGSYAYRNTGRSSGTVVLTYADGGRCTLDLEFDSAKSGRVDWTCTASSGATSTGSTDWRLVVYVDTAGFAPANQSAVYERFRDKRLVNSLDLQGSVYYLDFLSETRFREFEYGSTYPGTWRYTKTGANSADVVLLYDDGDRCDVDLTFNSETSGAITFDCDSDGTSYADWQAVERP